MSNLTIRTMVKLGPWTFLGVDDKGFNKDHWEHCEIEDCGEHIRYVHVLQRDDDPGQKEWRIGSTCGPKLSGISDATWELARKDAEAAVRLLYRAERMQALEDGPEAMFVDHLGPKWVDPMIDVLKAGDLYRKTLPFKNYSVTTNLQVIKLRIARAEKAHGLKPLKMGAGK